MIAAAQALPLSNDRSLKTGSGQLIKLVKFEQRVPYLDSMAAMSSFASERVAREPDQIWMLEHPPVYTQGTACDMELLAGDKSEAEIPIVKSDRGGQITYHGPGQIIMYPLLKLRRYDLGVKALVDMLEQSVITTLGDYGVRGERRKGAPGVYVQDKKIAALGLRIRRGTSYHGLSFNIDMDLQPFSNIHPCGYEGLQITQLKNLVSGVNKNEVGEHLLRRFVSLI